MRAGRVDGLLAQLADLKASEAKFAELQEEYEAKEELTRLEAEVLRGERVRAGEGAGEGAEGGRGASSRW